MKCYLLFMKLVNIWLQSNQIKGIFNNCHHNNTNIWEGTSYAPFFFVWVEYDRERYR